MAKRSKDEDEELSAQETGSEESPPPQKKPKKSSEKKAVKKSKAKVSKESDEEPPSTSKKYIIEQPPLYTKNVFVNTEGEKFVDLGKKKRATVRSFRGTTLIDIREFWGDNDDLKPGKKGISLSLEQWNELKSNADSIDDLIRQLS
ncbi:RNA polymerase II transcriptional coactivator [Pyrrhoderma noxium]|uniref:RNA polymerase II transcriptional coactivator n=1 Tax=Pyrrhoderma noxium TaxID=2282107 RepID=A0A286UGE4_9AGAM|nr:RNA polymerase II transcriptional coactivator [Pyrrhoderma noxium]